MNRAAPVYLTYKLPDRTVLVACWNWTRLFHSGAFPEVWELVPEGDSSDLEVACIAKGYRLVYVLEARKEAVWKQIQAVQNGPRRSRKQQAKYRAREEHKREQEAAQAAWLKKVHQEYQSFQMNFSGLDSQEIRRLHRRLAREHHPDLGGSSESFQALDKAYKEALSNHQP